jgi:hypothetical protein
MLTPKIHALNKVISYNFPRLWRLNAIRYSIIFGHMSKQVVSNSISKGCRDIKPWRWKQRHCPKLWIKRLILREELITSYAFTLYFQTDVFDGTVNQQSLQRHYCLWRAFLNIPSETRFSLRFLQNIACLCYFCLRERILWFMSFVFCLV